MTRTALHLFSQREEAALTTEQAALSLHRTQYNSFSLRMQASEHVVEDALNQISLSDMDEETGQRIRQAVLALEQAIADESVNERLVVKYEALALMLRQVVIENNSLEAKAAAMETYLAAFRTPSSQIEARVKLGLGIASLALIVGLMIASAFIIPLIPFTALFTLMGMSAAWAGIATSTTVFASKLIGMGLSIYFVNKIAELVVNPLSILIQRYTDECKNAQLLSTSLQLTFFRAATPAVITTIAPAPSTLLIDNDDELSATSDEEQEPTSPLLSVKK